MFRFHAKPKAYRQVSCRKIVSYRYFVGGVFSSSASAIGDASSGHGTHVAVCPCPKSVLLDRFGFLKAVHIGCQCLSVTLVCHVELCGQPKTQTFQSTCRIRAPSRTSPACLVKPHIHFVLPAQTCLSLILIQWSYSCTRIPPLIGTRFSCIWTHACTCMWQGILAGSIPGQTSPAQGEAYDAKIAFDDISAE